MVWRIFSNLFVAAAGAGLLSYPYAVKNQGVVLCCLLTALFGALNVVTDFVLIAAAHLFRGALLKPGAGGFDYLCLHALGPRMARAAGASIVLGSLGAQIGYLIAIGDLLAPPLQAAAHCPGASPWCALTQRFFVVPAVAFTVTLPLTFVASPSALGHSSLLAAVTVLAVAAVVAAQGISALRAGSLEAVAAALDYAAADAAGDVVLSRWTWAIFLGIPISVFSLGNHMQIIPVYLEAKEGSLAQRAFPRVVACAVASCVVLYLATGLAGYVAYRRDTNGDIMTNLPAGAWATVLGKVLLAVHLLLSYPILFLPARRSLIAAAGEAAAWLRARGAAAADAGARACDLLHASSYAVPLLATASSALLAVAAPSISVVFGLLGATVATFQIYTVPGLLLLRFAAALDGGPAAADAAGAAGDGIAAEREATWAQVPAIWGAGADTAGRRGEGEAEGAPLLAAATEGGEGAGAAAAAADTESQRIYAPRLLPLHSAFATRALGWLLIALSVAIGFCGTAVFCLSTWAGWGA